MNLLVHRWLGAWLAVLAAVLVAPALGAGFQLDDHFHRFRLLGFGDPAIRLFEFFDGDPAHNATRMEAGVLPWWAAPGLRHSSFRYLSVVTMQVDYLLWPNRPELMHLHSLVWLGAAVAAAALVYRRTLGAGTVAGIAALLYAVDDAHALPATYLANRNALIAVCFGCLSLACFERARRERWRLGPAASAGLLALALASSEMGVATAAYLLAFALCLDTGPLRPRLLALAPNAAVLAVWAALYRLGGFGAAGSGFYRDPLADPAGFALTLADHALMLVMGQWTPVPSDLALVATPGSAAATHLRLFALAVAAGVVALLVPLLRRDPVARFFALGASLSLVPVAAVGPQNRLLGFVGLGSMGLLAQLVSALFAAKAGLLTRLAARVLAVALLAVHLALAPALGLASIAFQARAASALQKAVASVPSDPSIAGQDLVLVNPPDYVYLAQTIPVIRRVEGAPSPRVLRALVAGGSALAITRVDARSLRVELDAGLFPTEFSRYFRSPELRFSVGERVELTDFGVEILSLDAAGDPNALLFRFAVPLEDGSLRWLYWSDGAYAPFRVPAPGETARLPAGAGIFG